MMSEARKGKGVGVAGKYERTPEIRAKISTGVADFQLAHPEYYSCKFYKSGYVLSDKADQKVWVRSSWERRVLWVLDQYDEVTDLQVEPFRIPYELAGVTHQYLPDFLVTFDEVVQEIWEVKPVENVGSPKNQAKFAAAQVYADARGMHFRVVTLATIESMEQKTKHWLATGISTPVYG